jgi:hypothetical protein
MMNIKSINGDTFYYKIAAIARKDKEIIDN